MRRLLALLLALPLPALGTPPELALALEELGAPDVELRRDAAARLAESEAGLDLLIERIRSAQGETRALLLTALGAAQPNEAVLALLDAALADPDAGLRAAAAEAAAGLEGGARPLVLALRALLVDEAADVRLFSALAMGYLVEPDNVTPLIALLDDPVLEVRTAAAESLASHGRYAISAIEPLRWRLLEDDAFEVRAQAARALGRIGVASPTVQVALAAACAGPEASVRKAARESLGLLGPAAYATISALIPGLYDPDEEEARAAAAWALGRMGPLAHSALSDLTNAAISNQALVADEAITALARIGDRVAIDAVLANPPTRRAMFEALAIHPPAALTETMMAGLTDWVADTRYAAMRVVAPRALEGAQADLPGSPDRYRRPRAGARGPGPGPLWPAGEGGGALSGGAAGRRSPRGGRGGRQYSPGHRSGGGARGAGRLRGSPAPQRAPLGGPGAGGAGGRAGHQRPAGRALQPRSHRAGGGRGGPHSKEPQ
jgi:HEAT repeat protein